MLNFFAYDPIKRPQSGEWLVTGR